MRPGSLTLDEPSLMRDAALADAGLAYMWEARVRGDLASGHLVSVLLTGCHRRRGSASIIPTAATCRPLCALSSTCSVDVTHTPDFPPE